MSGVAPPPLSTLVISTNIQFPDSGGEVANGKDWVTKAITNVTVPDGYYVQTWKANLIFTRTIPPRTFPNCGCRSAQASPGTTSRCQAETRCPRWAR